MNNYKTVEEQYQQHLNDLKVRREIELIKGGIHIMDSTKQATLNTFIDDHTNYKHEVIRSKSSLERQEADRNPRQNNRSWIDLSPLTLGNILVEGISRVIDNIKNYDRETQN